MRVKIRCSWEEVASVLTCGVNAHALAGHSTAFTITLSKPVVNRTGDGHNNAVR